MISEDAILEALRSHAGIDPAQTGEASLRKDIRRAIAACPHPQRLLDTSSQEWKALLETSLVPETWFFRNAESFEALKKWVVETWLPAHPGARLQILSLPCCTGEEPYSIAMSLLEAGISLFHVRAGDISEDSVARARAATYRRNSFRTGFDESHFGKYFEDPGGGVRKVTKEIREMVSFDLMNLADPSVAFPTSDVIFCRNVLIYFGQETQRDVLTRLRTALDDDGILFLGPVEPPLALQYGFSSAELPMAFACTKKPVRPESRPQQNAPKPRRSARPATKPPKPRSHAVASVLPPPPAPKPAPVGDSIDAARALADAGDATAAAAMLDRLSTSENPTPELFCLRGVISDALGRGDLAEACYRKALYLDPSHAESLAHLALFLELNGRAAAAERLRRRAGRIPTS